MRAVLCRAYGPPESLVVDHADDPVAGPGQVVVDVEACAVNFPDVLMIQDLYQYRPQLPFIPGTEVVGVVSAVGPGATGLAVGDTVFATTFYGGLAEKVAIDAASVIAVPPGADLVQAAGFLNAYGTSYYALQRRAGLRTGETLLVLGAAGGVGLAAVELGSLMGATVIAAASTDEKLATCRDHGASLTLNYVTEDLKTRVKELTGGAGADVVYDPVGGPLRRGRVAIDGLGWSLPRDRLRHRRDPQIPLNLALLKGCSIIGVFYGAHMARQPAQARADIDQLLRWWQDGKLRPHVSSTYPLEQAGAAIRDLADRRVEGRAVVRVRPS